MDAFLVFQLPYEYKIENLDAKYYSLFKSSLNEENLSKINAAYLILKDPQQRLEHLIGVFCNINEVKIDVGELFDVVSSFEKEQLQKYSQELLAKTLEFVEKKQWLSAAQTMLKQKYIKKF